MITEIFRLFNPSQIPLKINKMNYIQNGRFWRESNACYPISGFLGYRRDRDHALSRVLD